MKNVVSESPSGRAAWLHDINVFAPFRRRGYGSAILAAAAEELVAREGWTSLGLNVFGDNEAAVALYRRNGYDVSSMSLRKSLSGDLRSESGRGVVRAIPRRRDGLVAELL
ncbi:GNAT family N-acetyltransferase, partial [Streptomyces sp. NPDC048496]|uniref:GNAT family N-acetyltransferase n=1 Tax=Streptomyces sp. NPDC048496 TaxID=3365558 RepID=UPI003723A1DE